MNKKRILILLLLLLPLVHFAMVIYLPSLPAMEAQLQISNSIMRWTLTVFMLGLGLSQLVYGPFSDHFGRRPVLFFGLSVFFLATVVCAFATNAPMLLIGRLLQGVGIGVAPLVAHAIFGEIFEGRELARATSYNTIAHSLPPLMAPALGGYIQHYFGWRENFMFLIVYVVVIGITLLKYLPETRRKHRVEKQVVKRHLKNYLTIIRHARFVLFCLCLTSAYSIIITYNMIAPFLLQGVHHISAARYGELTLLAGVAYLLGAGINSFSLRWLKPLQLTIIGGLGVLVFGLIMFYLAGINLKNIYYIILPSYGVFFSVGLTMPNVLSGAIQQFPKMTGTSSALANAFMLLGSTVVSYFIGHLPVHHQYGLVFAFTVLGVLILVGCLGLSLTCEKKHAH